MSPMYPETRLTASCLMNKKRNEFVSRHDQLTLTTLLLVLFTSKRRTAIDPPQGLWKQCVNVLPAIDFVRSIFDTSL